MSKVNVGNIFHENMNKYLTINGFEEGDELKFVRYHKDEHTHWDFDKKSQNHAFTVKRNANGELFVHVTRDTFNHAILINNWDFIFSKEIKEVVQESWEGVSYQALTEDEKLELVAYIFAGFSVFHPNIVDKVYLSQETKLVEKGTVTALKSVVEWLEAPENKFNYYFSTSVDCDEELEKCLNDDFDNNEKHIVELEEQLKEAYESQLTLLDNYHS